VVELFEALKRFLSGACLFTPELLQKVKPKDCVEIKSAGKPNLHLLSPAYRLL